MTPVVNPNWNRAGAPGQILPNSKHPGKPVGPYTHPAPSKLSLETMRAHPDPSLCVTDPSSSVPVAQAFWCCCPTTRVRAGTRGAQRPGRTPGVPPASGGSFSSRRTAWFRRAQGQARNLCVRTGQREYSSRRGPDLRNLAAP